MSSAADALFLAFQEAVVGRYAIERELGRGGMGIVYLAREVRLDRPVAIKLLPPDLAAHGNLRDRFMREARTAARFSHPYIVPIHSVDEAGGFVFYVMAFVDGETLAQRVMARGPLRPAEATRMLREVAWALAYAHSQGVIHRDIKPGNILLERGSGRAMVTDFGIARLTHASAETAVGELLGTPEYMSPEQAAGETVDARSDLYSLGIVAFYAVTGSLPITAPTTQAVLAKQLTQPAPPVATIARSIPRSLAVAIDTCLHKDPVQRVQSGEALADALAAALDKRAEVPIPIRSFLDPRKMWTLALYPGISLVMGFVMVMVDVGRPLGLAAGWVSAFVATVFASSLVMPIALVTKWLRPLLKLGYGPADIASGLSASFDRKREEYVFEHGTLPGGRERALNIVTIAAVTANVGLWAAISLGAYASWLPSLAFITGAIWPLTGLLSARTARVRTGAGSWWAERWDGAMGRWLTRLASINLGARAAAADRPTEMAIAMAAEGMFDDLPKEIRKMLGDVPGVLKDLESQAAAMRVQVKRLDASLQDVQGTSERIGTRAQQERLAEDLRTARAAAEQRLSDIVTALDTLRLDILRLRAGQGPPENVTQDLDVARTLVNDIDRLITSASELEASLRRPDHAPTPV